jgi:HSP20 family protein
MNHLCYSLIRFIEWSGLTFPAHQFENPSGGNIIMAITRWDPFREVVALQNRVNSLFRDLNDGEDAVAAASFVPAVDIYEDAQKVVLKLEVPGVEQKDLDIRVENHTLTVKGERKFEKEEKEQNFHRIERRYGSFFRAFTLPSTVDTENVQASYNAGVLKLELAKKPEAQPKQIKINVGGEQKVAEPELAGVR